MNCGKYYANKIHAYECDPMPKNTAKNLNNKIDHIKANLDEIINDVSNLGCCVKTSDQRKQAVELLNFCKRTKSDIENLDRFVNNHTINS